jgi:DNA-binding YbaB/EbfC family protein
MDLKKMMKEAARMQAKLQEEMQRAQDELASEQVEGSSGGGLVKVVVNCHKQLVSVSIAKEAVDPEDIETLEDMVFAAMQAALSNAEARAAERMAEVQGQMGLPAGMDLGGLLG